VKKAHIYGADPVNFAPNLHAANDMKIEIPADWDYYLIQIIRLWIEGG